MWLQRITDYLLEHRFRALALTFICTFLPVLGALSILFAALVTLRKGIAEGGAFALAATLPYLLSVFTGNPGATPPFLLWTAVSIIVVSNVLTWVYAVLAYKRVSLGALLQWSALLGIAVVSVVHLVYPEVDQWWAEQLTNYLNQSTALIGKLKPQAAAAAASQLEVINVIKYYVTGAAITAVLLNGFLQLVLALWWQAAVYKSSHLRRELLNIRFSPALGGFLVVGIVLSYVGNRVAIDIMPILYMIFCIAGLSLVHYVVAYTKASTWWLIMLYLSLIWLFPYGFMGVGFMALGDIWLNFRRRISK